MTKKFIRYKLLCDEGFTPLYLLPKLNGRHDLKHILVHFKKYRGREDSEIYKLACKEKRLVLTFNIKHFRQLAIQNKESGIIGVSSNLSNEKIENKILSLLSNCHKGDLYGKYTAINLSTTKKDWRK